MLPSEVLKIKLLKYSSGKSKISLGDRAFMYAASKLWNNLPLFVRKSTTVNEFKTRLNLLITHRCYAIIIVHVLCVIS